MHTICLRFHLANATVTGHEIEQLDSLFEFLAQDGKYISVERFKLAFFKKQPELSAHLHHGFDRNVR